MRYPPRLSRFVSYSFISVRHLLPEKGCGVCRSGTGYIPIAQRKSVIYNELTPTVRQLNASLAHLLLPKVRRIAVIGYIERKSAIYVAWVYENGGGTLWGSTSEGGAIISAGGPALPIFPR